MSESDRATIREQVLRLAWDLEWPYCDISDVGGGRHVVHLEVSEPAILGDVEVAHPELGKVEMPDVVAEARVWFEAWPASRRAEKIKGAAAWRAFVFDLDGTELRALCDLLEMAARDVAGA